MPSSTSPLGNPLYGVDRDTRVSFHRALASQMVRYEGRIITLGTARGKTLIASPEQILLSANGWVTVDSLRNGNRVFSHDKTTTPKGKGPKRITPIAEVHGLLSVIGERELGVPKAESPLMEVADMSGYGDMWIDTLEESLPLKLEDLDEDEDEDEEILPDHRGRFTQEQEQTLIQNMHKRMAGRRPSKRKVAPDLDSLMSMSPSSAYLGLSQDTVVSVSESETSMDLFALKTLEGWYVGNGFALYNCECAVVEETGGSDNE